MIAFLADYNILYYLIGILGIVLIWGIIYVFREDRRHSAERDQIVPIKDLNEIKELSARNDHEEVSPASSENVTGSDSHLSSPDQERMNPFGRPVLSIRDVDQDVGNPTDTVSGDEQASPEPQTEKEEIEDLKMKLTASDRTVKVLTDEKNNLYERMGELKNELENFKRKQSEENAEELKASNEDLKRELDGFQKRCDVLEKKLSETASRAPSLEVDRIMHEKDFLEVQLKENQANLASLQEDMEIVKMRYDQKLKEALSELESLKHRQEQGEGSGSRDLEAAEAVSGDELVERLKKEKEELIQSRENLENDLAQLKEVHDRLREKERLLQYELTKNRAKAIGLEKICKVYKEQMESRQKIPETQKKAF